MQSVDHSKVHLNISIVVGPSVTRWPDCVFNIWPFTAAKICPKAFKLSKVSWKLCPNQINLKYIAKVVEYTGDGLHYKQWF